jgi:hypothetical protein
MGTSECVMPILSLTTGPGLPAEVKEAARQAVESVRGRLGRGRAGRLTIVDAEDGGQLSEPRAQGGGLSPPDDLAGALSRPPR